MTANKGLWTLSQILEKHTPLEMFVRFSLKKGLKFTSSRSFDLSDCKAGALMAIEDWLFIPSAVVGDLYVFPEGHLAPENCMNRTTDKVKPFEKLYVVGDYEMTFKINLIKNASTRPLQRFLDTFGDKWGANAVLPDTWEYVQQNYLPSNPSKADFRLKADLRALD